MRRNDKRTRSDSAPPWLVFPCDASTLDGISLDPTTISGDALELDGLTPEQQVRLVDALDAYLIAVEEGREVDPDQIVAEHPDLDQPLRRYLAGLQWIRTAAHRRSTDFADFEKAANHGPFEEASRFAVDRSREGSSLLPDGAQEQAQDDRARSAAGRAVTSDDPMPSLLGPYRLGREIGRGAMGVVYRATDTRLQKRVAVKVLAYSGSLDTARVERFRLEAKTAASLDHPNVVSVYSVGCERGTHYYAMQWIDGESLDRRIAAARRRRIGNSAASLAGVVHPHRDGRSAAPLEGPDRFRRIARFCAAAAGAIDAAHRAGIIHRDVKPSNLILGNDGQLWVTDFGLARVQADDRLTRTGDLVGTVRYMSPEQARGAGDLIDARTDVYGLGATLYELATLQTLHQGEDAATLLHEIRHGDPPAPRALDRSIPRDLDTIIRRSLRPRPADRYPSAAALAEDLLRFAEGKPIRASAVSLTERAIQWGTRHRKPLAAAAVVASLFLLGWLGHHRKVTREQSEKRLAVGVAAEAVETFYTKYSRRLETIDGAAPLRQELLADALAYFDRIIEDASENPELSWHAAETRLRKARLVRQLGTPADADAAFGEAVSALRSALDRLPPDSGRFRGAALTLAEALAEWASASRGKTNPATALARLDAADHLLDRVAAEDPTEDFRSQAASAWVASHRALVSAADGQIATAAAELHRAVQALPTGELEAVEARRTLAGLADALSDLNVMLLEAGAIEPAIIAGEQAVRLCKLPNDAGTLDQQVRLAVAHNNLAAVQWRAGQLDSATLAYEKAKTLLERVLSHVPGDDEIRGRLAVTLNNLGMAYTSAGEVKQAEMAFLSGRDLARRLSESSPRDAAAASRLSGIENNLGVLLRDQGREDDAADAFKRAMQHQRQACRLKPGDGALVGTLDRIRQNLAEIRGSTEPRPL